MTSVAKDVAVLCVVLYKRGRFGVLWGPAVVWLREEVGPGTLDALRGPAVEKLWAAKCYGKFDEERGAAVKQLKAVMVMVTAVGVVADCWLLRDTVGWC